MRPTLIRLIAGALLATAAQAQFSLTTTFADNNGLSGAGATVYFDITVINPVRITAFDINTSAGVGAPVGLNVYTAPMTYVGNEGNAGAWTLVANDDGMATGAGRGGPTSVTLQAPFILQPGTYGMALENPQAGGHAYTNGNGTNQAYSDANLSLMLGASSSPAFNGSPITPRVWNGTIYYGLTNGLFASFTATPTSGASPLTVSFTDTSFSSDPGGITAWEWDFDGDGSIDSTQQNPTFVYNTCGRYTVSLTVRDAMFPASTFTQTDLITVDPNMLVSAAFQASPRGGIVPFTVQFTDTSTGMPTAWDWDVDGDGITDSLSQNFSFTYTMPGTYDVTLIVQNACGTSTEFKMGHILALASGANPVPDLLQYQFNEVRGTDVANSAPGSPAPSHGTVSSGNWQADPGDQNYRGNEAGFGCLSNTMGNPGANLVSSGYTGLSSYAGDMTIMWRQRMSSPPGTTLAYCFGGTGGSFRCFTGGVANTSILYRGSSIGDVPAMSDVQANPGVWQHFALVIDDAAGTATWYIDGVQDAVTMFAPGTHTITGTSNFNFGYHSSTSSTYTKFYDLDDFRLFSTAIPAPLIILAAASEAASNGTFDASCDGVGGPGPSISGSSIPYVGNLGYSVELSGAEPSRPAVLALGIQAHVMGLFPFDLSPLLGTGCTLGTFPEGTIAAGTDPSGNISIAAPIPANPVFAGFHAYVQYIVIGSTGQVSQVLDVNFQNQ